jgi:hypothetical protein
MISERQVDVIASKQDITEQIYRYCRSMDRIDHEIGKSVSHADGTADYGPLYTGLGSGFTDLALASHMSDYLAHSHQVTNILIEVDGDRAKSEAYVTVTLQLQEKGKPMQNKRVSRAARRPGTTMSRRN